MFSYREKHWVIGNLARDFEKFRRFGSDGQSMDRGVNLIFRCLILKIIYKKAFRLLRRAKISKDVKTG